MADPRPPGRDGGYIAGTIIKPKLGLRPEPFARAAYQFWLGGDFIKNDEPQGNQVFAPMKKTIPLVRRHEARHGRDRRGQDLLANITADDHYEMIARGEFILETFGPDADKVAFLVDGYVGGPGMITTARRASRTSTCTTTAPATAPSPRPVRSAATPPTCWPRCPACRALPASTSAPWATARWKAKDDRAIAYIIERDEYQARPIQKWYGMRRPRRSSPAA